ncbi:MAG: substrate-binding domain-containing protein [Bacteroidetes bacterium]|uniref:Substrate-binding domain-containing protein n=1 Tax=Candidatus Cryptobacteroides excrementavium TaxID=2840759 RepID=A0A9D9J386_9BACT|nr:substrate-binding domain-containing protein [Candidatus Cryptobacteroides excrementavium]
MARIILMTDFSETYARDLLLGIARYAHDAGQAWSLCRLPLSIRDKYGMKAVVDYAVRIEADAVIGQFYETDEVGLFAQKGILAIAQDFRRRFSEIPNITGEHYLAGKMCGEYFLKKGFRHFAFYGIKDVVFSDERYEGFRDTVTSPGNTFSALIMPQVSLWNYDFDRIAGWLRELPKPVAVMACDDNQAYFITEVCRRLSVTEGYGQANIPESVALIGVDNDESVCRLSSPTLSSLGQDAEKGGYEVAQLIDRALRYPGQKLEDVVVHPTVIYTRQSSDIFVNDDPYIASVLKLIHENIGKRIAVDELVREVPLSRRLLEVRFKRAMGTSIYDYILQIRIQKISELLSIGMTVSEAAAELGIVDVKNLSRTFKKIKGITPSEYREKKSH